MSKSEAFFVRPPHTDSAPSATSTPANPPKENEPTSSTTKTDTDDDQEKTLAEEFFNHISIEAVSQKLLHLSKKDDPQVTLACCVYAKISSKDGSQEANITLPLPGIDILHSIRQNMPTLQLPSDLRRWVESTCLSRRFRLLLLDSFWLFYLNCFALAYSHNPSTSHPTQTLSKLHSLRQEEVVAALKKIFDALRQGAPTLPVIKVQQWLQSADHGELSNSLNFFPMPEFTVESFLQLFSSRYAKDYPESDLQEFIAAHFSRLSQNMCHVILKVPLKVKDKITSCLSDLMVKTLAYTFLDIFIHCRNQLGKPFRESIRQHVSLWWTGIPREVKNSRRQDNSDLGLMDDEYDRQMSQRSMGSDRGGGFGGSGSFGSYSFGSGHNLLKSEFSFSMKIPGIPAPSSTLPKVPWVRTQGGSADGSGVENAAMASFPNRTRRLHVLPENGSRPRPSTAAAYLSTSAVAGAGPSRPRRSTNVSTITTHSRLSKRSTTKLSLDSSSFSFNAPGVPEVKLPPENILDSSTKSLFIPNVVPPISSAVASESGGGVLRIPQNRRLVVSGGGGGAGSTEAVVNALKQEFAAIGLQSKQKLTQFRKNLRTQGNSSRAASIQDLSGPSSPDVFADPDTPSSPVFDVPEVTYTQTPSHRLGSRQKLWYEVGSIHTAPVAISTVPVTKWSTISTSPCVKQFMSDLRIHLSPEFSVTGSELKVVDRRVRHPDFSYAKATKDAVSSVTTTLEDEKETPKQERQHHFKHRREFLKQASVLDSQCRNLQDAFDESVEENERLLKEKVQRILVRLKNSVTNLIPCDDFSSFIQDGEDALQDATQVLNEESRLTETLRSTLMKSIKKYGGQLDSLKKQEVMSKVSLTTTSETIYDIGSEYNQILNSLRTSESPADVALLAAQETLQEMYS